MNITIYCLFFNFYSYREEALAMVVETVSKQVSDSNASLKDVNIALRNNFAILESLDKSDPKRDAIRAENEKLLDLGFEVIKNGGLL